MLDFDTIATHALILAQGGATKMLAGWGLVILGLVLGLLVVCRPSARKGDWRK
jgi:hypothetical protein